MSLKAILVCDRCGSEDGRQVQEQGQYRPETLRVRLWPCGCHICSFCCECDKHPRKRTK